MCARVIAGWTSGVTTMLIPFSRLYLSDANVRKTRSEDDDIQLSADIEARGLLQNLLVTKSKKRGKFAVIAGGRRLRVIEMIVTRGAWAPDTEIECKLLEGSEEEAGEASLAENFQRVGMSPAEECRAAQRVNLVDPLSLEPFRLSPVTLHPTTKFHPWLVRTYKCWLAKKKGPACADP